MDDGRGLSRERVLGAAVRLLDLGLFRAGGEQYAQENGTFGLATPERGHVAGEGGSVVFHYPAKGGTDRTQYVHDPRVVNVINALRRRGGGGDRLLAYWESGTWHGVHSDELNAHIKELTGTEASAKDFRTWHATVLAAVALAVSGAVPTTVSARKRAMARAVREVADYLGNTPAVCRASYIDDRLFDRYRHGQTIDGPLGRLGADGDDGAPATEGAAEEAVLDLLAT